MNFLATVFFFLILSQPLFSEEATLLFGGDTHFQWSVQSSQRKNGILYPVKEVIPLFRSADFAVLNIETWIGARGKPLPGKSYIINADIENIVVLNQLNIGLALLGNNHTVDMGEEGLVETISNLRTFGIPSVGAGKDPQEASSPYIKKIKNLTFAFFSLNEINETAVRGFATATVRGAGIASIRKYRPFVDVIIVNVHWGMEYWTMPTPDQTSLARLLVDSGADAVIGHHPHIPQGFEVYKNKPILYSLGNFLFGSINSYQNNNLIAELKIDTETKRITGIQLYPLWGTYRNGSGSLRILNFTEARPLWEEFYVQSKSLNPNFSFQILDSGIATINLVQEATRKKKGPISNN